MRKLAEFRSHPVQFPCPEYRAVVKHIVDGDTIDVVADLGFNQYAYLVLRVRGVDAPELYSGTPEERSRGTAARDFLVELAMDAPAVIRTYKDRQSFGRYEADVVLFSHLRPEDAPVDLATAMVTAGHAVWSAP